MVFQTQKRIAAHEQVYRHMQELLRSGQWTPGMRLPTTRELAEEWKTYPLAVHHALTRLTRRGMLLRRRGHGTFVQQPKPQLACVGLYYSGNALVDQEHHMLRAVHQALLDTFSVKTLEYRVWTDHRSDTDQDQVWPELRQAAENHEIDALIIPSVDPPHWKWLSKLPIPLACACTGTMPNRVADDFREFVDLAVADLVRQGCRSTGLIVAFPPVARQPDGTKHPYGDFFEYFAEQAGKAGLALRDEWMVAPRGVHDLHLGGITHERFGYNAFTQFWQAEKHPDGLVVMPDSVVRGVILGLSEKRVRVPDKLKLVFHKNQEVDLVCPFPATLITLSAAEMARGLVAIVEAQFRGRPVKPRLAHYRLMSPDVPNPN